MSEPGLRRPRPDGEPFSRGAIAIVALCCMVTVSNVYLSYPILSLIAQDLGASESAAAWTASATQIGYAIGLFLLIPLGDIRRRKPLVGVLGTVTSVLLAAAAASWEIGILLLLSLLIGGATVIPHVLIPYLVDVVPAHRRGSVLAIVNAALATGIVLSRVGGGGIGEILGWRSIYVVAAVATAGCCILAALGLPRERPRPGMGYPALIRSTVALLARSDVRWGVAQQMPIFGTFTAVWSLVALLLTGPDYSLSVATAGLIGLIGLLPLLTAVPVGRLLDRHGPAVILPWGVALMLVATIAFLFSAAGFAMLLIALMLVSLGQQSAGVANQTRMFALDERSRSRLNTLYISSSFVAGALAAGIATLAYAAGGWLAVTMTALAFGVVNAGVAVADIVRQRS